MAAVLVHSAWKVLKSQTWMKMLVTVQWHPDQSLFARLMLAALTRQLMCRQTDAGSG